jgi:hypothetical protein
MKKSLVLGILSLATAAVTSYGQGAIYLDNYVSDTYNQVYLSAALGGGLVPSGYTAGIYYDPTAGVNLTGLIGADPSGTAIPTSLNAALVLATGSGSTAPFIGSGFFTAGASFGIQPGALTPAQGSYTIMVVAYNGSSYATSTIRGHSAAVYFQDASPLILGGGDVGNYFPASTPMFSVASVPEPTTLALGTLGGLGLLLFRRKQA